MPGNRGVSAPISDAFALGAFTIVSPISPVNPIFTTWALGGKMRLFERMSGSNASVSLMERPKIRALSESNLSACSKYSIPARKSHFRRL